MSTRNELPGVESPGKDLCMVRKNRAQAKFCNLQSIFSPRHACMHKPLPIMRHPTYLHTYMRHIAILSGHPMHQIVLGKPGNTRIDIRGHAQENSSQNGVSSLRRSPGPWDNGSTSETLWSVLHMAWRILVPSGIWGGFTLQTGKKLNKKSR